MQFYRSTLPDRSRSVQVTHRDRDSANSIGIVQPHPQEEPSSSAIPSYMRELAASRVTRNRHSRASSIVSTATKLSTTTFGDDARSIDLVVGGQYFRIARDGSRIYNDVPPPYGLSPELTPPLREHSPSISEFSETSTSTVSSRLLRNARYVIASDDESEQDADEGTMTPRQRSPVRLGANILNPAQLDLPSPVDEDASRPTTALAVDDSETPVRNRSYKEGPDVLTLAPESRQLRQADFDAAQASGMSSPLRRRNGVRLPSLDTQMLHYGGRGLVQGLKPPGTQSQSVSAGPVLYRPSAEDDSEPRSPDFIGRRAHGIFPRPALTQRSFTGVPLANDIFSEEHQEDSPHPLPMESANDISLHYAGMVRKLDHDHRQELLFKEREVTHLRQRLVEMDTVYRQELRARDFIIDDLRARLQNLEEQTETRIEKARNSIEDIWETRWKAQSFHLWERMRRIEEESQKTVDRILAQRQQHDAGDDENETA